MAAQKQKGKSRESYYTTYKVANKHAKNRLAKLIKLHAEHPNNEQITKAMDDIHYRRATPKKAEWSHSDITSAKLFKRFTGKFDKNVLLRATDERSSKAQAAAIRVRNENIFEHYKMPDFNKNSMFSLKERAHSGNGVRVWI